MEKIILLGAGGYAEQLKWVVDRMNNKEIIGFVDETIEEDKYMLGLPVKKTLEEFNIEDRSEEVKILCAVGNIALRKKWFDKYKNRYVFTSVIDPTALVSSSALIGNNVIILGQTVLSSSCRISDSTNINWFCLITHHTSVGEFTNISSGVRLTGHASIGSYCDIGTNATIIPYKKVGNSSIIGAGAVVIADIPDNSLALGIPAKVVKKL